MPRNLVVAEYLQVFKQKDLERGKEKNANYELVMKDLISHFFLPGRFSARRGTSGGGCTKPRKNKIRYFICHINNMVKNLKKFSPFEAVQCLPEDKIIQLVEFSLPK